MPIVDLFGAIDIHIHSNPSLFTRVGSDLDIARHAADNNLSAILLKNHFESTVGRAHLTNLSVEGTKVFGGLVLNHFTGGVNPCAVEHAVKLGAKQIWLPSVDAMGHVQVFGRRGGYGYQDSDTKIERQGIAIVDTNGQLKEDVKIIVELLKENDLILGTGHITRGEIFELARYCQQEAFNYLLVTHPYFNPPNLNADDQSLLTQMGAMIELCGGNLYPIPGTATLADYLNTISKVDVNTLVISSDAGQPRKSMPAEVLRVFTQCLMEKGIAQEQIDIMTKRNPARLLGLSQHLVS
jgi:hypothetical protein